MEQPSPVCRQSLLQLADSAPHDLRLQINDNGVDIELTDLQLRFQHSFLSGPIVNRAKQPNQLLLKVCNNKQRTIKKILDLTAGWGVDAYTLAHHGHTVTLLENSELVYGIVAHSLSQLATCSATAELAQRLVIENTDAKHYLQNLHDDHDYDCIYLDPMFPAHKSGAKPAKEMQILQALTDNTDIESCIELALSRARLRVVVKRAAKAAPLGHLKPDLVQRAKTIRFDVYLTA
jgi:16S rRNA (guanine1516-N2)-methyltransferase